MDKFTALLTAAIPFAVIVTKAVDTLRNTIDRSDTMPKVVWNVAAFGGGVLFAILTHLNIATGFGPISTTVGRIVTGLAIGAMAGFWHEPLSGWGMKSGNTPETIPARVSRRTKKA